MKTEVVDISPTRKEIKIEIDVEAVRAAYDRICARYAKHANVPGFRRGHAPRSVVRTRFKDEIRGEVLRELVPQAINDAIIERALDVIGEPEVHLENTEALNKLGEQPISLHVHVEVLPEVQLGEYRGMEAARRMRPVTDEDVDRMIENLREASAALQPVEDRGAQLGDTVTVDFRGRFVQSPEAEEINVEDVDVELGGEGVQQEFTDNLLGVRPDEERVFTVRYPEDFNAEGLAGKEVEYTAKVKAVGRKELPELDDEWAKSMGEAYDSVATLREKLREGMAQHANLEAQNRLRNELLRKLVEAHPFEVPQTLLELQTDQRLQTMVREMIGLGIDPRHQGLNWEEMREQLKDQAARDVRGSMLLDRIADEEQIEVSDEEVEAEIERIAEAARQAPEQVRAALTKQDGKRSIADRLRNRKALDLLVENARVTDEEWREETFDEGELVADPEAVTGEAQTDQTSEEAGSSAKAQSSSQEA